MPSEKTLLAKQSIVADLAEELKGAATLVVADHRGLSVAQDTELRAAMRKAGVSYKVVKNTILTRASEAAGYDNLDELFKGPSAIAFSEDPIAAAKVMHEFADKFDKFEVKGGAMEGKAVEKSELKALAMIPPVEVLYAQVVGGLASPITGLALIIDAIRQKVEAEGGETAASIVAPVEAKAEEESATEEAAAEEASETTEA